MILRVGTLTNPKFSFGTAQRKGSNPENPILRPLLTDGFGGQYCSNPTSQRRDPKDRQPNLARVHLRPVADRRPTLRRRHRRISVDLRRVAVRHRQSLVSIDVRRRPDRDRSGALLAGQQPQTVDRHSDAAQSRRRRRNALRKSRPVVRVRRAVGCRDGRTPEMVKKKKNFKNETINKSLKSRNDII